MNIAMNNNHTYLSSFNSKTIKTDFVKILFKYVILFNTTIINKMLKVNKLVTKFSTIEPHAWMLNSLGFKTKGLVFNPSIPQLYQIAIAKKQQDQHKTKTQEVSSNGAFVAYSLQKPTQSVQNYKIVKNSETDKTINWNRYNVAIDQNTFHLAQQLAIEYINQKGNCIVVDGYAGWDPSNRLKVRTFCSKSYHALFMHNMLIKPTKKELLQDFSQGVDISIFNASQMIPAKFISGIESDKVTALSLTEKKVAILGNESAQQMRKALFKTIEYHYPKKNVLPLHASSTIQRNGDVTVFFGLQESQKTAFGLVSQNRKLIGAEQIAWGKDGIFNVEGGCYTKILNHSKVDMEVQNSIKYGSLVQNAIFYPNSRNINFYDVQKSNNAKTSFPLNFMKNAHLPSIGSHPKNLVLFTCETNGVLPPVAKLSAQQAFYYFLSGYSCKINQRDSQNQIKTPVPKFETCFGQEFLSRNPGFYGKMLYEKIKENNTNVWLVNTGWIHGKYGQGERISNEDIQKIINSIIKGELEKVQTFKNQYFNFSIPQKVHDISQDLMHPQRSWKNKAEFDQVISKVVLRFYENYVKKFKSQIGQRKQLAQIIEKGAPKLI